MKMPNLLHSFRIRKVPLMFLVGLTLLAVITLSVSTQIVQALPEYSTRTGESCAACHVSAGGGGPRTLRGMLWSARGKPDAVPILPGMLLAPHVADGGELYQIACAGCHGDKGEGLSARGLTNIRISIESIRSFTIKGIPRLGMPAFKGQFTDTQMKAMTEYVAGLANGTIQPPAETSRLLPARFVCGKGDLMPPCEPVPAKPESRGN